jgi:magnesium chelatase family protein
LLDRIDLHIALPPVDVLALQSRERGEPSATVRERVVQARSAQAERVRRGEVQSRTTAELSAREVERVAVPDAEGSKMLALAVERLGLSARAYAKVLRVARTIADLEGSDGIRSAHIAEAVHARLLDRDVPPPAPIRAVGT